MSGIRFDKLRVLVVDDNQHMRKLIVAIMQAFGVRDLFESSDGEHAWTHLRDSNPDVIILDWQMTGMTGLEFTRLVRNSPRSPNIFVPIIMLTGHTHIDHVRQARDSGANEFLAKPVSVKAIMSRLMSVIEFPRPYIRTQSYFGPCRRRRSLVEYRGPERRTSAELTVVD
jgi:two-component system, chemotaxis family, chemotaxis protein CheY